ncbi:MAG: preprotein translocase subunit YajC [Buchnera aphidicola (Meitanaphis microgallis)]
MNFLISEVFAASSSVQQNSIYSLLFMVLFFLSAFYFVIFRPQKKRANEHKALIRSLSKGDEVLTTSGFVGKVKRITKIGYVLLELNNNIEVLIKNDYISLILPKNTLKNI